MFCVFCFVLRGWLLVFVFAVFTDCFVFWFWLSFGFEFDIGVWGCGGVWILFCWVWILFCLSLCLGFWVVVWLVVIWGCWYYLFEILLVGFVCFVF